MGKVYYVDNDSKTQISVFNSGFSWVSLCLNIQNLFSRLIEVSNYSFYLNEFAHSYYHEQLMDTKMSLA